jgi:hypothetical protein
MQLGLPSFASAAQHRPGYAVLTRPGSVLPCYRMHKYTPQTHHHTSDTVLLQALPALGLITWSCWVTHWTSSVQEA